MRRAIARGTQLRLVIPPVKAKPSARADWSAAAIQIRAQSILTGTDYLRQCPPLTLEEARDVLAWHEAHTASKTPTRRFRLRWPFRTSTTRGPA
jgi:hypothetical protein